MTQRGTVDARRDGWRKAGLRDFVPDIDEPTWRTYDAHHVPKSGVVHFDLKPKLRRTTKWHSTFIPESPKAVAGGHSNDQELKIVR